MDPGPAPINNRGSVMDFTPVSSTRYADRSFTPALYEQAPQRTFHGGTLGPSASGAASGASPLPGSRWSAEDAVWVEQGREIAGLEREHVSEAAQRLLSRLSGVWEVQSWTVGRLREELDSQQRTALATDFLTRSAINRLMALGAEVRASGSNVDIYA